MALAALGGFAGYLIEASWEASSSDATRGTLLMIGAAITALFVGLSAIREHASLFLVSATAVLVAAVAVYVALD